MNKLLTIAIPTYNRAPFLKECISKILTQIRGYEDRIELLVSDNCSTDETENIVQGFISDGAPIRYNRNETNLGMDGNFVYCFEHATGEYVWILGDDDYLVEGAITKLMGILQGGDYGLVHLKIHEEGASHDVITDKTKLMDDISYWITYISSNIVRTKYVSTVDFSKYMGTYFVLLPVYLNAVVGEPENVIVRYRTIDGGKDTRRSGGYNFFQVFIKNYLNILREYIGSFGLLCYEREKYRFCRRFLYGWAVALIATPNHGLRYETKGWFGLFMSKYWYEPYFYVMLVFVGLKRFKNRKRCSKS